MRSTDADTYRFAFAVEHEIGHVTFARLLKQAADADPSIVADWHLLRSEPPPGWQHRLLAKRNYTLQMGLRTRLAVEPARRELDALLIHTQTAALLSWRLMKRLPTVISTDITPKGIDRLSGAYIHRQGPAAEEEIKRRIISSMFRRARFVVPSTHWTARSLRDEYGVPDEQIRVVKSGVDVDYWVPRAERRPGPPRLLFVGGDFDRKGGRVLLAALSGIDEPWELDVVTKSDVATSERVRVHRSFTQGDAELLRLYQQADIFTFPTLGDAVPWVVLEAMASGTSVVSTDVGAIPELVPPECGIILPPGDATGLRAVLRELFVDLGRRCSMAKNARAWAEKEHDASKTFRQILGLMKDAAHSPRSARGLLGGP
jgi:glycosyltransferase involved in cell wall biosynthesis